ncbi:dienelactone hydrolase family protein [soil metagenome]
MKVIIASIVLLSALYSNNISAQEDSTVSFRKDSSGYLKRVFTKGNVSMPYRLLLPRDYDSSKKYPMVLFLHGSGERGNDNEKQLTWGSQLFIQGSNRRRFPAIVVFPQCPENSYWSNVHIKKERKTKKELFEFQSGGEPTKAMDMLIGLQTRLMNELSVDTSKIYVMGLSMGGMGTYEIVRRMPGVFASAVPICGGADTTTAAAIHKTAFWIFHGANDDVVPVKYAEDMVRALQGFYSAGDMQYTVYSGTGHNSWEKAFAEPELLRWLFTQRLQR